MLTAHTDDNTFLGFVVEIYGRNGSSEREEHRGNWSLVYGKESYMWKNTEKYLDTIAALSPLHATASIGAQPIHPKAINHGVQVGQDFHKLLRQAKIFVGLGFPYEGPAPLEAIANGAVFLNPIFKVPKGRRTDKFFADKPTLREVRIVL